MVVATMKTTTSLSIFLLKQGKEKDFDRDVGDDRTARLPLASPLDGFFSPLHAKAKKSNLDQRRCRLAPATRCH